MSYQEAIAEFSIKVQSITGRPVRQTEIAAFIEKMDTAVAHRTAQVVEMGFCDFQTISGRAELIRITF